MREAGLVAVFGASVDLMEFEGAVQDEVGAYNGAKVSFSRSGIIYNLCVSERCPYHQAEVKRGSKIEARWDVDGFSWRYKTDIPHVKFVIKEDDENYCEGIVFALADVPALDAEERGDA
jgi:hypothetical protein